MPEHHPPCPVCENYNVAISFRLDVTITTMKWNGCGDYGKHSLAHGCGNKMKRTKSTMANSEGGDKAAEHSIPFYPLLCSSRILEMLKYIKGKNLTKGWGAW